MINDVERILKEKGELIEKEMLRVIPKNGIPNLQDAVWYHLSGGGKRIRPVLAIMACETLGGDTRKVLPFSAACEIMHNWLLVHDDIEDQDEVRRDRPAVWKKYGLAHGVNVGDYMSEKVYELVLNSLKAGVDEHTTMRLLQETVFTCAATAEGQAMDINLRLSDKPTEKNYFDCITGKTAYYLMLPIVGGAIVAGADDGVVSRIKQFGMKIGPAFQIADDLLDLTEGKGRGEIGCDIKEGKRTLMVVRCLERCSPSERARLLGILNKPREKTTDRDVAEAKRLFEKHGSMEYARKKAESLVKEGKASIATLPPKLRYMLGEFADYLIQRKK